MSDKAFKQIHFNPTHRDYQNRTSSKFPLESSQNWGEVVGEVVLLCCSFFCEVISGLWAQFGQAQILAYSVGSGLSSVHWPMQSIVFNNSSGLHFQFLARNALLRHHGVFAWGLRPCSCSWMLKDRFLGNAISYGGQPFTRIPCSFGGSCGHSACVAVC